MLRRTGHPHGLSEGDRTGPRFTRALTAEGSARYDPLGQIQHGRGRRTEGSLRTVSGTAGRQTIERPSATSDYYHALGTDQSADRLIYERTDEPTLFIDADLDETSRYLFIQTNKGTSNKNELFVKDLGDASAPKLDAPVTPLYPGHTAAYLPLGVVKGTLYLQTDREAPLKKIVAVPIARPEVANLKTIVPEAKDSIEFSGLVAGQVAVSLLQDVASTLRFYRLDGTLSATAKTPDLGTVTGLSGRFDRSEIFYTFTSPLYPATVFRFDPATGASIAFEPPKLTFDPALYETERVFFASKDGTRVPMFITHKKGLKKDGTNPTMLYGYGGFDIPMTPTFGSHVPAWLERGGVWATANLRGGSEYGEAWHEAGMHEKKQNVFDVSLRPRVPRAESVTRPQTLGIMADRTVVAGYAVMERGGSAPSPRCRGGDGHVYITSSAADRRGRQ